jgi:hypothetical protein
MSQVDQQVGRPTSRSSPTRTPTPGPTCWAGTCSAQAAASGTCPAGKGHATFPHLHLYTVRPDGHFATPRQTLESAVQWCIEMGAEPQNPQERTLLAESEGIHQL